MSESYYLSYATNEPQSVSIVSTGNAHIPNELAERWPTYNFLGKPFRLRGRIFIRAFHKTLEQTHFYDVDRDWFWWETPPEN